MDARKDSIVGLFSLYLPPERLDIICRHTNVKGKQILELFNQQHPEKPKECKDVDAQEMAAFIALLIAAGKIHGNQTAIPELRISHPAFRNPFFTAIMSRSRFQLLCAFLRFDDKITRCTRIEDSGDKLQAIREVTDIFVKACIQNYSPKENLTLDEILPAFRGKCPFIFYMKSNPGRYGI
ncbi:hypothetical protein PR048_019694 [Dryococelus australis]|uniref:PiggyBac transposable element-derived protein domain-containing protein n=1 Tax=Dryococelus australis TaxID=614101 RepID=A0ABQ9H472_9NEOP|nr:hypothetical protein PR048_019694 [Dryococelus australis]